MNNVEIPDVIYAEDCNSDWTSDSGSWGVDQEFYWDKKYLFATPEREAAPDLLEALEDVLDALGFLCGGDCALEGWGIDEVRGAEIRAAIAKAKGEPTND